MYEGQTQDVILKRMLDKVTSVANKQEGTLVYDALAPVSVETTKQYMELDSILLRAFAQTSYGTWLDMRAAEFGLTRKSATKATGQIVLTGANGTVVPAGFKVQTSLGLRFIVDNAVTITGTTAIANITAENTGTIYNIEANLINMMVTSLGGLTSIVNTEATAGGTEIETDKALAARLLLKVRNPAVSGNVNHYKQWALEIDGVGDAKIYPIWNGGGTVKVCLIDSNCLPASANIVNNVLNHINESKPIGSTVTCEPAAPLYVNTSVTVVLDGSLSLDATKANISANLTQYFKEIAFKQSIISYAKVSAIIINTAGVADIKNLTINTVAGNINIDSEKVAILGILTIAQ